MKYTPEIHHRRSIRLKEYDYSQAGAYFVTICTHRRKCLFGEIRDGQMILNEIGILVNNEWLQTSTIRPNIIIDEFIVMPNHLHGVLIISDYCRGTLQRAPTINIPIERFGKPTNNSIPTIVRLFKSTTTKQINQLRQNPFMRVWQRNYYEHVVRNEKELNAIREYIINNPLQWELDIENPNRGTLQRVPILKHRLEKSKKHVINEILP